MKYEDVISLAYELHKVRPKLESYDVQEFTMWAVLDAQWQRDVTSVCEWLLKSCAGFDASDWLGKVRGGQEK